MRRPYVLGAAAFVVSLAIFLALAHAYGCTRIGGLRHWVLEAARNPALGAPRARHRVLPPTSSTWPSSGATTSSGTASCSS